MATPNRKANRQELTTEFVKILEARPGRYEVTDSTLPQFSVRVGRDAKTFFVRLHVVGTNKRVSLGKFPHITPEDAREKAMALVAGSKYRPDRVDPLLAVERAEHAETNRLLHNYVEADLRMWDEHIKLVRKNAQLEAEKKQLETLLMGKISDYLHNGDTRSKATLSDKARKLGLQLLHPDKHQDKSPETLELHHQLTIALNALAA